MKNENKEYSVGGFIFSLVFTLFGGGCSFFILNNKEMSFKDILYKNGMELIIFIFFFLTGLFLIYLYFINVVLKPKRKCLYLKNVDDGVYIFYDKSGKKYKAITSNTLTTKRYYDVLKTKHHIYEIIGESGESFELVNRKSYWLNFYSPFGNFEDMLLLPILYLFLFIGIFVTVLSPGIYKVIGIFMSSLPLFILIYDYYYKYKLKNIKEETNNIFDEVKNNEINESLSKLETKSISAIDIYKSVVGLIVSIPFCIFTALLVIKMSDITSKILVSPFFIYSLVYLIGDILEVIKSINRADGKYESKVLVNEGKNNNIIAKAGVIAFLLFWFMILSYGTYNMIRENESFMVIFTIPFWIVGVFIAIKMFNKNNK